MHLLYSAAIVCYALSVSPRLLYEAVRHGKYVGTLRERWGHLPDGIDPGGFAGVHARSAIGGFDGAFSVEPEIIVAIPATLASAIISNRGWVFPLPPVMLEKVRRTSTA